MANPNSPLGFIPYSYVWGAPYSGSFSVYFIPASNGSNIFIGDPVDVISGSNDAFGRPAVQIATSGSPVTGVIVGIVNGGDMGAEVAVTRDLPIFRTASSAQYVAVADDPNLLHLVQDDASAQATAPNLWSGKNANFISGSGSTVTGYSGYQLRALSVATTNTLDLKIFNPIQRPDNLVSTVANVNMNAKWLVKFNNSRWANQLAGV